MSRGRTASMLVILTVWLFGVVPQAIAIGGDLGRTETRLLQVEAGLPFLSEVQGLRGGAESLASAVALSKVMVRWQMERLGIDVGDPRPSGPFERPSEALMDLAGRYGVEPDAATQRRILELDGLSEPLPHLLVWFVSAFLNFDDAARTAAIISMPSDEGWSAIGDVVAAREYFLDAILALRDGLRDAGVGASQTCDPVQVPAVFSIDVAECDNLYEDDFLLLLDAGGDDVYHNNAGGTFGVTSSCRSHHGIGGEGRGAAALVDLGEGNDMYGSPQGALSCGANGGAYNGGAGFLLDEGGNDTYLARRDGVNGGANAGAFLEWKPSLGFLLDAEGDDLYASFDGGTNGGGAYPGAIGFLLNLAGDDRYLADLDGINGGAVGGGAGLLVDGRGDDYYHGHGDSANGAGDAVGIPPSPGALIDLGGNDTYTDPWIPDGTCTDCSVIPKGVLGLQVDLEV